MKTWDCFSKMWTNVGLVVYVYAIYTNYYSEIIGFNQLN